MAEFNFKFSDANYETESNGQKIKMPLIRVECDNEDFYKTVNWQDGKNPFDLNQNRFYIDQSGNICNDKGNVIAPYQNLSNLPELNKTVFEDGYYPAGNNIYKVNLVDKDNPKFEFQDLLDQNKKWDAYINKNGILTNDKGEFINRDGSKLNENESPEGLADNKFLLNLARKEKANLTVFRFIARQQKTDQQNTIIRYFVKENLKDGSHEDIYIDADGDAVDSDSEKILGKNNQPQKAEEKYKDLFEYLNIELMDLTTRIKCACDQQLGYAKILDYNLVLGDKTGFLVALNFFDYEEPKYIFIDKKDGKIYDHTGKQRKKINLIDLKLEDVKSDTDRCSNVMDRELWVLLNKIKFDDKLELEYEVADKPENMTFLYYDKNKPKIENNEQVFDADGNPMYELAERKVDFIKVKTKIFGQEVDQFLVSADKNYYPGLICALKESDSKTFCYCKDISEMGTIKDCEKAQYVDYDGKENLFDAIKKAGYFEPEFIINDTKGFDIETDFSGQIHVFPFTLKINKIGEFEFLVDGDGRFYKRGTSLLDDNKEVANQIGFDFLGNSFGDNFGTENIFRPSYKQLLEAFQEKGLFIENDIQFDIDPELHKEHGEKNGGSEGIHFYKSTVKVNGQILDPDIKLTVNGFGHGFKPFDGEIGAIGSRTKEILECAKLGRDGRVFNTYNKPQGKINDPEYKNFLAALRAKGLFKPKYYIDTNKISAEVKIGESIFEKEVYPLKIQNDNGQQEAFIDEFCYVYVLDSETGEYVKAVLDDVSGIVLKKLEERGYDQVDKHPDLLKVWKANFPKIKDLNIETKEREIALGPNKVKGYVVSLSESGFGVSRYFTGHYIFDKESTKFFSLDFGSKGKKYEPDDLLKKEIFKELKEKNLFTLKYEIGDKKIINGHDGYEIKIKSDYADISAIFMEFPSGNIYDADAKTRKKIDPFDGKIKDGEANANDLDLFDLRIALDRKNIKLADQDGFVSLERDEKNNGLLKLTYKNQTSNNNICYIYIGQDGFAKKADISKTPAVYTPEIINIGNGLELNEFNKVLAVLRRHMEESEIEKLLDDYQGKKLKEQVYYTEPNKVFKQIKFDQTKQYKEFELTVTVGPADNKALCKDKMIKGHIDKDGYMKDENGFDIDANGYSFSGGIVAARQKEIQKVLGDEIKNLPGYMDPEKELFYSISQIEGIEDLVMAEIEQKPDGKKVTCYIAKDGYVYDTKEKTNKQKLVIDNKNKTVSLDKLKPGEEFNLTLPDIQEDKNFVSLLSRLGPSFFSVTDSFYVSEIKLDREINTNEKKTIKQEIIALRDRKNQVFYVDKETRFKVNEKGRFIDKNNNEIDFEKDKDAASRLQPYPPEDKRDRCNFLDQSGKPVKNNLFESKSITERVSEYASYFDKLHNEDYENINLVNLRDKLVYVLGHDILDKWLKNFDDFIKKNNKNHELEENGEISVQKVQDILVKEFSADPKTKWISGILSVTGGVGSAGFVAFLLLGTVAPWIVPGLLISGAVLSGGIGTALITYGIRRYKEKELSSVNKHNVLSKINEIKRSLSTPVQQTKDNRINGQSQEHENREQ